MFRHFLLFLFSFVFRYTRLIVNAISFWTYKPFPILAKPTFCAKDVTVVLPTTLSEGTHLVDCLRSILQYNVAKLFLVTSDAKVIEAKSLVKANGFRNVQVIGVPKLGKRLQMVAGLKKVLTPITIFVDDDVIWPEKSYLPNLLAPFEDSTVGAVGTGQRCIRHSKPNFVNFLGIAYLERRIFNTASCNRIDGGLSTLSGRTAAYRTVILRNEEFFQSFQWATWRGRTLNSDDDKCLTRYVFARGWKIRLQITEDAVLYTMLDNGLKFFTGQCVRWARAHWRGNAAVVRNETYWWKSHPWTCYSAYIGSLQTPALLVDGWLFYTLYLSLVESEVSEGIQLYAILGLALWIFLTKTIKLLPHFRRWPCDIRFLPASIAFSYLHGIINIYALCTLSVTVWGSRTTADKTLDMSKDIDSMADTSLDLASAINADPTFEHHSDPLLHEAANGTPAPSIRSSDEPDEGSSSYFCLNRESEYRMNVRRKLE